METKKRLIFDYGNYRTYLKDLYEDGKLRDRKFSYQYYSRLLGFSSKSFFKHVIDGNRNLSSDSIQKIIQGLKLSADEAHYFKNLVLLNQSTTSEERAIHSAEINRSRAYRKSYPLRASQFKYLTQWYFVAVRELVNLPHFKEDYDWIARQLQPNITTTQAKEAVEELMNLGLLSRDERGRLHQGVSIVSTADEVTSAVVAQYHRELMKKASESIDTVPREKRDISGVTFRISKETASRIKEMIQNFRKELAEVASQDQSPEAVYQLNMQLFPLTQMLEAKTEKGESE